ncbi:MAG: amidohydrolase [Bradymonadales bacterium]|nr:amidohydrolase [Bradymonadales bacterium]
MNDRRLPVLDCHVHLTADGPFGSFLSPRFRGSVTYRYLLWKTGLSRLKDKRAVSEAYLERIVEQLDRTPELDGVVLLALDGRYTADGRLDRDRTGLYTSNDYCFEACKRDPRLFPAASINPKRRDALEELERVVERGAVCLKVLPNSQDFDPADPSFRPFWRRMAELGLPLLAHTGKEHTIEVTHQEYGHPQRLIPALEEGVTVIAAHCGTSGPLARRETFPDFTAMLARFPKLYGDLSDLTGPGRGKYLGRLANRREWHGRLVYGSDYPVPSFPLWFAGRIGWKKARQMGRSDSSLSLSLAIVRAFGFPPEVFTRAAELLRLQGKEGRVSGAGPSPTFAE